MAMLPREVIESMGFASLGENVLISDRASFYGITRIKIGSNVRIDDFCVLSAGIGGIDIGCYIHSAGYCALIGGGKISLSDYCNLSSRVSIYSSNDDYSGSTLTNPTIPIEFTGVTQADVFLDKHVIVGSGSVILHGVVLEEGVAVGALSLITKSCKASGVYAGNPARRVNERKRDLLDVEQRFLLSKGEYNRS